MFSLLRESQKKLLIIITIKIFAIYLIYLSFPNSIKRDLNTTVISSLQSLNSSLNSSSVLLPFNSLMNENSTKIKYLVNTEFCKMIEWPLFDAETRPLFHNYSGRRIKCRSREAKVISAKRVDQTLIEIKVLSDSQLIPQCFATEIVRERGMDSKVTFGRELGPIELTANLTNCDAVRVRCYQTKKRLTKAPKSQKTKVFEEIIALIPEKHLETKNYKTIDQKLPNVLMLGIDSISWLNFKRQFSLTQSLAEKHKFYPIYGYNKVGDNTFPNLMPVLTGQPHDYYWNESITHIKHFDDLPFIWKEFSQQNFITTFIEDYPKYSLFNYKRPGFVDQPTDYYLRPVSLAIDKQLRGYCYKDRMEIEFYFNFTYDLIEAMKIREQKFFGFIFMAHLTHNYANYGGYADLPVYTLLSKLFDKNLMKDTILFLFADHGIRLGKLRETASGTIEERLPFLYIYLPKSFKTPKIHQNLVINSHRLTTPFDVYATLRHIVKGESVENLSHGKSLFEEIPVNRSCDSEQISQHWCVCTQHNRIDDNQDVSNIAKFVVSEVNRLLKPVSKLCKELVLNKILSAYESTKTSIDFQKFYLIRVNVRPSFAIFEATVRQMFNKMTIIGDISRINKYGKQSDCIDRPVLQKYCFC